MNIFMFHFNETSLDVFLRVKSELRLTVEHRNGTSEILKENDFTSMEIFNLQGKHITSATIEFLHPGALSVPTIAAFEVIGCLSVFSPTTAPTTAVLNVFHVAFKYMSLLCLFRLQLYSRQGILLSLGGALTLLSRKISTLQHRNQQVPM